MMFYGFNMVELANTALHILTKMLPKIIMKEIHGNSKSFWPAATLEAVAIVFHVIESSVGANLLSTVLNFQGLSHWYKSTRLLRASTSSPSHSTHHVRHSSAPDSLLGLSNRHRLIGLIQGISIKGLEETAHQLPEVFEACPAETPKDSKTREVW